MLKIITSKLDRARRRVVRVRDGAAILPRAREAYGGLSRRRVSNPDF